MRLGSIVVVKWYAGITGDWAGSYLSLSRLWLYVVVVVLFAAVAVANTRLPIHLSTSQLTYAN